MFRLAIFGSHALRQLLFWVVLLMVALVAAGQFGVQPIMAGLKQQALPSEVMQSIFRDRFAAWHGVSSVLYLIECVLGLVVVVQHGRGR
jgi:membrane-anchored glycerophosphoryl diester phosphodiesterase (GDPDase)